MQSNLPKEAGCIFSVNFIIRFTFTTKVVSIACIRIRKRPRYLALVIPFVINNLNMFPLKNK